MEEYLTSDYWLSILKSIIEWTIHTLPSIIFTIIILLVVLKMLRLFLQRIFHFTLNRAKKIDEIDEGEVEKRGKTIVGMLYSVCRTVLWTIVVIIILEKLGINVKPILAGAGILGLAVGFGAQELVRDYISGFFIILENQVRTGDVAIINGTVGLVEKLELRTITLRDYSGTVHIFQNGKINTLSNKTKEWSASVFDIDVAYKENTDNVVSVMKEVADQMSKESPYSESIIEPIEIAGVDCFAQSSVVIKARIKTKPNDQLSIEREYKRRLKMAFDEKGIEIPFPHTVVLWGNNADAIKTDTDK